MWRYWIAWSKNKVEVSTFGREESAFPSTLADAGILVVENYQIDDRTSAQIFT